MTNLEYIEAYFNQEFTRERKMEFEQRIGTDPELARDVAFYLSTKEAGALEWQQEKDRFRELYMNYKQEKQEASQRRSLIRLVWPWAAVAAVLAGIIFSWNAWFRPVSPGKLADKFIKENFETLAVSMGAREDSLQKGLRLYNDGRFAEAQVQFEALALRDTSFTDAIKYAGIVSLRLEQYDKAIDYFSRLSSNARLYANPGKFYKAVTLLKRNRAGDKEVAKLLLQQVVREDLEGTQVAKEWLKEL